MKHTIYIPYNGKKYPVEISKPTDPDFANIETAILVECLEAGFSQEWDITDLPALLELLPELIAEKRARKKQNTINLRITSEEKRQIEIFAKQSGHKNVSSYIRERALQES